MKTRHPIGSIIPTLEGVVLEVLNRTTEPLGLREVHRLASQASVSGLRKALHRLVESGVVVTQGEPPRYSLNREHLAYPAVEVLTGMREALFSRIRDAVQGWAAQPELVGVFGSVARGDADLESDVDILVVGEVEEEETTSLAEAIERWTGKPTQIMTLSSEDVREARARGEPILAGWRRDLVPLIGSLRAVDQGLGSGA